MSTRRIQEFLDGNQIRYAMIRHSPAYTAQEVAESSHVPGRDLAKTVIVLIDGKLAMAVVPATRMVDVDLLRLAADAQYVAMASEADFRDRFEGCQLGTVPPFGVLFGMETYMEKELAKEEMIAFNAGTHSDLVAMRVDDFRRLVHPKMAPISMQEETSFI